jgi:raffinose/stachyose/melibiose transport system substrate-binding protein
MIETFHHDGRAMRRPDASRPQSTSGRVKMAFRRPQRRVGALIAAFVGCLALAACGGLGQTDSGGGGGGSGGGNVTLSFLVDNNPANVKLAEGVASAFHARNPNITVKVTTRPQGGDGDNVVKTRLATGEMDDVFAYNSGSLFQALSPQKNLVPLTDQPWVSSLEKAFRPSVSTGGQVYGAPYGSSFGGGVLYNKKVFAKLGLKVPKTWGQFMANNAKIKAAGVAPVIQTYQDTWTSQLFVLGDYHNVQATDPSWAAKYTRNQVKYVQSPAFAGFQHLQQVHAAGYENKDYRSIKFEQGLRELATGKGAQYPMLSNAVAQIATQSPRQVDDVGFFALPGDDAAKNGVTLWLPGGVYIPKTTTGAKLDAAKKLAAFMTTKAGCDAQTKAFTPAGPYMVKGCDLPSGLPPAVTDLTPYVDSGQVTPALEFLSPVKGPALEQITVEVGSGLRSAQKGASLYDQDVKKQAQQLGLPGW